MPDITTEVLIIGTGPAGSAASALRSTYSIDKIVINRDHWLVRTSRVHITNQRRMKVLRNLGRGVQDDAYMFVTSQDLMGDNTLGLCLAGD